jgi:hypothetical protein
MEKGSITVIGDAGNNIGEGMRGGEIHLEGDCSGLSGSIVGGRIYHKGNLIVDKHVGHNRQGGSTVIKGNVGQSFGQSMQGGTITIHGNAPPLGSMTPARYNPMRDSTAGDLAPEKPPEGKVKIVALFSDSSLEKDYGSHSMIYDGRKFSKYVPGSGKAEPSSEEVARFRQDVKKAAQGDIEVADYVNENPGLLGN